MNLYGNNLFFALLFAALFVLQFLWLHLHPHTSTGREQRMKQTWSRTADTVFILCIALAVASLFRLYPGNARPPIQDSSAFLYIGKRMSEGKLPYRDLFDHKGPLLYLIEYCGIRMMPGSFTGVWLLEVLNLLFTAFFMLRLANIAAEYKADAWLSVMAVLGVCGWMVWQGGNFTEEFALPWITSAAWICGRFFESGIYRKRDIVLLGAGFAAVLLLRANMIAAWAALMPIVFILLLRDRRFADIGKCTFLFFGGALLVLCPMLAWAWKAGFLKEFLEDYILFNLRYTDAAGGTAQRLLLSASFAAVLWPAAAALVFSLILRPRKTILWYNFVFFAVSAFTAAMSGRLYYHYAIVMLPAAVLPFATCFDATARLFQRNERNRVPAPAVMIAATLVMLSGALGYRYLSHYEPGDDAVTAYLKKKTEIEDDVLVIGNSSWYYLLADRKTENRFFYQLPPMEISDELREAFFEELEEKPSDYVLLPGYREERDWMNEQLGGIRSWLETQSGLDYEREEYEDFEVYIRP